MRRVFGIGFPSASWRQIWRNGQSWWSSGCHPRFATLSAQPTGRNWSYGRIMFSVEGTLFGFIGIRSHDCFLIWSVNAKRRMTGASHFQNSTGMRNEARKILRSRCSASLPGKTSFCWMMMEIQFSVIELSPRAVWRGKIISLNLQLSHTIKWKIHKLNYFTVSSKNYWIVYNGIVSKPSKLFSRHSRNLRSKTKKSWKRLEI